MKRWQRWTRLGLIGAASLVLVVTVLPEVASGVGLKSLAARLGAPLTCSSGGSGSSGASGSGSSGQCGPGTLTGKVKVTGAPKGFAPAFLGAGACPAAPSGLACANPTYALAIGGSYSLLLGAGKWDVAGFYENNGFGGVFLSPPEVVTIPSGGTVKENFTVPYEKPATLTGKVSVTDVPNGVNVYSLSVLLCPSFAPYTGGFPSIACVNGYVPSTAVPGMTSAPFTISGLPSGEWTAFPSYCTQFGCATNPKAGKKVHLSAGDTNHVVVTTSFLAPAEGQVSATVKVTGAPPGFNDPLAVSACQVGGTNCQTFYGYPGLGPVPTPGPGGNTFTMILPNGHWNVQGLYQVPPFYNVVTGPSKDVTVTGGHTSTVNLVVPYQALGGVAGTIKVTGKTQKVPILAYTVVACPGPSSHPSFGCINEYSGPGGIGFTNSVTRQANGAARAAAAPATTPFNKYQLLTLTPGPWTLYPGYTTIYGSYTNTVGTKVTITANQTTTKTLSVPFQPPAIGVVTGTVFAIGVPQNGFQTGAHACSAPPTATSCPNEQFGFTNPFDGMYTLSLSPGAWWVAGFVDVFGIGQGETTSPAQPVTVTAGSETKLNFTITAGAP